MSKEIEDQRVLNPGTNVPFDLSSNAIVPGAA